MEQTLLYRYLVQRDRCRKEIYFLAYLLRYFVLAKDHSEWHDLVIRNVNNERFSVNLLPRGWFKTTLVTICWVIQVVLKNRNIRILIISWTGPNAKSMLGEIANQFLLNDDLRFLFGIDICPNNQLRPETNQWTEDGICVKRDEQPKECTIEALGADQNLVSKHFDIIIPDDLVVLQNTRTADQITKTKEFYVKCPALLNMHREDSKIIFMGNRWVPDDLYNDLECISEDKKKWQLAPNGKPFKILKVSAEALIDGKRVASYPKLFPLSKLDGLRDSDPITYSAFYINDPTDIANTIWQRSMLQYYNNVARDLQLKIYMGLDPAISERDIKSNSDTVVSAIGIDKENEVWALKYFIGRGLKDLMDAIFDVYLFVKKLGSFRMMGIETILFQRLIMRDLRAEMAKRGIWIPVREFHPFAEKDSRIMVLDGVIRNKAFHIQNGMSELETQIIRFGRPGIKKDILDATSQAYIISQAKYKRKEREHEEDNEINEANMLAS